MSTPDTLIIYRNFNIKMTLNEKWYSSCFGYMEKNYHLIV